MRETGEATHGSIDHAELTRLGLLVEEVTDFSASINPYGPAPEVVSAFRNADISRYPDRGCLALRAGLSSFTGVDTNGIICGNGSAELIDLLARAILRPGDTSLIVSPTFSEYERSSFLCGARVSRFNREVSPDGVSLDVEGVIEAITAERPRLVWLCNPNNPTGDHLRASEVERVLGAVRGFGGTLVVDEAYLDLIFDPAGDRASPSTTLLPSGGLVLLRSMTKSHALAGLRLGYALAPPEVVGALETLRPPWTVSSPAQAAGLAALSRPAVRHVEECVRLLGGQVEYLRRSLEGLSLSVVPGAANYLLVRVEERLGSGGYVRGRLLGEGFLVRDCASFGLPGYIRVAARLPGECRLLVEALGRMCEERGNAL
ncbi:MAG: pyridoxal phosphate-dependent aminotransferase [Rubrobacter sp.]